MIAPKVASANTNRLIVIVLVSCLALVAADDSEQVDSAIVLEKPTAWTVDAATNKAGGVLHLHNKSDEVQNVLLSAEDFVNQTTGKGLNAKTIFINPTNNTSEALFQGSIQPGKRLQVRVEVTDVWDAGESVSVLCNDGIEIGKLRVLKYRPPFNVKVASATPDKPELSFYQGRPQQITLRNDDGMTYAVALSIEVGGQVLAGPTGPQIPKLAANSSVSILVTPKDEWFTAQGFFREEIRDGTIRLAFEPPGTASDPSFPSKVIPFKARLSRAPEFVRELLSYGVIVILLVGGGACSLILSHWVPNELSRAKLRDRLGQLAERTRLLSSRIDSRLQVFLRVARNRLVDELYTRWSFSAELPSVLATITQRCEALEKLVDQVTEIDHMLDHLEQHEMAAGPPTLLEEIERTLKNAKELMSHFDPTQEDLQSAQKLVAEAKGKLAKLDQKNEPFAKELLDRLTRLQPLRVQAAPVPATPPAGLDTRYDAFRETLRDLFATADSLRGAAAQDIPVTNYGRLDACVRRLELVQEFIDLYDDLSPEMRAKIASAPDFQTCIAARSADKLHAAQQIVRQMSERIFSSDIKQVIHDSPPRIRMEPGTVRQFSPMFFSVEFPRPEFNCSAALNEVKCEWDYHHDGLTESGWHVWHYFPTATKKDKKHRVSARFEDSNGTAIVVGADQEAIWKEFEIIAVPPQRGDRNKAELVRLIVALFIALLGLLSGAREQLLKLDLIPAGVAVFLLGFGADSIKNVLAPKEK